MTELNLWGAFLDRNDVQALTCETRMLLISVATAIADSESDIEGFLARSDIRSVAWDDPIHAVEILDDLAADGHFVTRYSDPDGWGINGWTEKTVRYRPGNAISAKPAWGQSPLSKIKKQREGQRISQGKSRQKKLSELEASLTPPSLPNA